MAAEMAEPMPPPTLVHSDNKEIACAMNCGIDGGQLPLW
jgi:hypothetical protein